jgi:hypothetical protein
VLPGLLNFLLHMHTASLDIQSFISLLITEVLRWRRIPEELRTQVSDYQERG